MALIRPSFKARGVVRARFMAAGPPTALVGGASFCARQFLRRGGQLAPLLGHIRDVASPCRRALAAPQRRKSSTPPCASSRDRVRLVRGLSHNAARETQPPNRASSSCVGRRPCGVSLSTKPGRTCANCAVTSCSDIPVFSAKVLIIDGPSADPSEPG
jgi:hypothetical protein